MGEVIGTGGYAVVRACTSKETGEQYAVKVMRLKTTALPDKEDDKKDDNSDDDDDDDDDEPDASSLEDVMKELNLLARLRHPNIVRIHHAILHSGIMYVVMDRLHGPELMDALYELPEGKYSEDDVRMIMRSLLDAVSYMHSRGCVHRDLKLENLVLRKCGDLGSVTVVDFGLAAAARAREKLEEMCGTPWYAAPELLVGKPYTASVDAWACGVGLYALLSGEWPFDFDDEEDLADAIVNEEACYDEMTCSPAALDLLKGLLRKDPSARLSVAEALEHAWFGDPSTPTRIAATRTSDSLRHVHRRLENLASSNPKLPRVIFAPGECLVSAGEESDFVYLIVSGECAVLADGGVRVGTRRAGNFVGEAPAETHGDENVLDGDTISPIPIVARTKSVGPDATNEGVAMASDDPTLLSTLHTLNAWVGGRRQVTIQAVTMVRAIKLDRNAMAWAVDADYRVQDEFQDALRRRRISVAKAEKAAKSARIVELKANYDSVIREYFDNAEDVAEVMERLPKASGATDEGIFVKRLIVWALDRASQRVYELACRLLCELHGQILSADGLHSGISALMASLDDLQLDYPHAPAALALVLSRISVDELVAPSFLPKLARDFVGASAEAVIITASALVNTKHGAERILRVWGGGKAGTTAHARVTYDDLLEEYVNSHDTAEALRILHELAMPHYMHEFVKRLLRRVVEHEVDRRRRKSFEGGDLGSVQESGRRLLDLLDTARGICVVSEDQYALGLSRFVDSLPDMELDVPRAGEVWSCIREYAQSKGIFRL